MTYKENLVVYSLLPKLGFILVLVKVKSYKL